MYNYQCSWDEPIGKRRRILAQEKCRYCRSSKQKVVPWLYEGSIYIYLYNMLVYTGTAKMARTEV
jgi:hypothetical protein